MKFLLIGAGTLLFLLLVGGGVVFQGILLGILSTVCFGLLGLKCQPLRWFARKVPFLADLIATIVCFLMFPAGVTAFVGAATVGICMTMLISVDIELQKTRAKMAPIKQAAGLEVAP